MKKVILSVIAVAMTVLGLGGIATMSPAAYAAGSYGLSYISGDNIKTSNLSTLISGVINAILGVVGLLAVVMIIIGGINFITSQGDTGKVTKARNTILYGVIGMVIAIFAYAIVNFVITNAIK